MTRCRLLWYSDNSQIRRRTRRGGIGSGGADRADVRFRENNLIDRDLADKSSRIVCDVILNPDPVDIECRIIAPLEPFERNAVRTGKETITNPVAVWRAQGEV